MKATRQKKINGPLCFTKYMNDEADKILRSDIVGYLSFFAYYRDNEDPRYSGRKEAIAFLVLMAKKMFSPDSHKSNSFIKVSKSTKDLAKKLIEVALDANNLTDISEGLTEEMIGHVIVLLVTNTFEFSKLAHIEYKIEIEQILNHQKGLDNEKLSNILKGNVFPDGIYEYPFYAP